MRVLESTARTPILLTILAVCALAGCDDDKALSPPGISGIVVTAGGDPVSGAAIGLVYRFDGIDLPGDWDKTIVRPADKPTTVIKFVLPEDGPVTVDVLDYAGDLVVVLLDGETVSGQHSVVWDATDGEGAPVPGGMYYVRLILPGQEPELMDLFLYRYEDGEILRAPHALTNSRGIFTIRGELIPVGAETVATDETGQVTGTATISSAILLKAVVIDGDQTVSDSQIIDWRPGEHLGGLRLVVR